MILENDIASFFEEWSQLDQNEHIRAVYEFVPTKDPRMVAAALCSESSTAMWQRIGVTEDTRPDYAAKVVELTRCATDDLELWNVTIAHPIRNCGSSLTNLLTNVCGEGSFYCPGVQTIKLLDLKFPDSWLAQFQGPQFGIDGVRERLQIFDRPIFIGVVKPNLGLSPEDFADQAYLAWSGGLDIAKDDEMLYDCDWSPLAARAQAACKARNKAIAETGEQKWYLANISDDVEFIPDRLRAATEAGADVVMLNPVWTGLSPIRQVRRISPVPIMAHFAGLALLSRTPHFGIHAALYTKLMRIAGADLIGIAGYGERMQTTPEEVNACVRACTEPLGHIKPALPIPGGSDTAATMDRALKRVGHPNFGFIAGRGVFAHAEGPAGGAKSLRDAWDKISIQYSVSGIR